MNKKTLTSPLAAALLIALGTATPAFAVDSGTGAQSATETHAPAAADASRVPGLAVKVLRDIADARGALHGDAPDLIRAKTLLDQAEHTLDDVQQMLPTTLIKDRIWVAKKHLEYEDTEAVLPDLVPIYASLDELVGVMPTEAAKTYLDRAQQALEKGDKPVATEQLQAVDAALLYVEADLPLSSTRHLIAQAKTDIAKQDAKAADQALADAEDNVVFVSIGIESPLTQAKESLWRAWKDRELGRVDYAKAELSRAVAYLEQAAQSTDKVTREAAAGLVSEVRELHGMLEANDTSISRQLEQTWQTAKALSERSAEYISTSWQRLRAGREDKKELIEAKLHLADARIDHVYTADDDAAKAELAEAKGYLDTALPLADQAHKAEVQALLTQVGALDQAVSTGDAKASSAKAFQEAEGVLADLIHQL
ncbi:YfdX family protein [Thiorhodococcus mannitoliphagus]|uniref:YfdX family protein n=1 Tax=Thiorhodococcus mannitoliphagus TaxID=329406 RepID=A0A6P1E6M5_9GAMM|nr:YfdX family protein [Thiorhodococcus mannitoliphagus]NEX23654.1 YfdX family protein [Thiorhodococcus mannitoliphagus]